MTAGPRSRRTASAGVLLLLLIVVAGTVVLQDRSQNSRDSNSASSPISTADAPGVSPSASVPPGSGATSPPATSTPGTSPTSAPAQLPRGGTALFPRYRLVGFSGGPGTAAFGRLGVGDLDERVAEMEKYGHSYYEHGTKQILPVLELITVVVHGTPGPDRKYRGRIDAAVINQYLAAARRHRALLLLNVQPGRADFLPEVQALAPWLKEPDVGLALDPEWAVGPGQVPGRVFGHTDAAELNQVGAWLGGFVRANQLPQKAMVVHQLAPRIISNIGSVKAHQGVQLILSVDGIGAAQDKVATWTRLVKPMPKSMAPGFKLFFEEDRQAGTLMTPAQVLALRPKPDYVLYE